LQCGDLIAVLVEVRTPRGDDKPRPFDIDNAVGVEEGA